jgi:hypothetical protein
LANSKTDDDNVNFGLALRLRYELGDTSSIAGNVEGRAIRYIEDEDDDSGLNESNIIDSFLSYTRQDGKVQSQADIGVSYADIEDTANETDLFLRVNAARELGSLSRGGVRFFFGYDSESGSAVAQSSAPDIQRPNDSRALNIFYDQRGEIFYERSGKRSNFTGELYARRRDFVDTSEDETKVGTGLTWSIQVTRRSRAELFGTAELREFEGDSTTDEEYILGARVDQEFSRWISGSAEILHRRRTTDDSDREFDETAVFVSVGYQWAR